MIRAGRLLTAAALILSCSVWAAHPRAETVGTAVSVKTIVTGANGTLKRADSVARNERITTNASGLGHFRFSDGAKLAVGPNSSIVIDEYVLGSGNKVSKLVLNTTAGAFRWISGSSPSSAYRISTPVGTLGVRGTAVDIYIRDNFAAMVLLNGSAEWCSGTRCVQVNRPCQFIIARGGEDISDPRQVSSRALGELGGPAALYFLNNRDRLHPAFRTSQINCGLGGRLRGSNTTRDARSMPGPSAPRASGQTRGEPGEGQTDGPTGNNF
jgi:hypothetical protein